MGKIDINEAINAINQELREIKEPTSEQAQEITLRVAERMKLTRGQMCGLLSFGGRRLAAIAFTGWMQ